MEDIWRRLPQRRGDITGRCDTLGGRDTPRGETSRDIPLCLSTEGTESHCSEAGIYLYMHKCASVCA